MIAITDYDTHFLCADATCLQLRPEEREACGPTNKSDCLLNNCCWKKMRTYPYCYKPKGM